MIIILLKERYWENEQIQHINRLSPRAEFTSYQDIESALTFQSGLSGNIISLNGIWDFKLYESPLLIEEFDSLDCTNWQKIRVPSNWQIEGYGNMQYTDSHYPFNIDPPHVPTKNPTGVYSKSIVLPKYYESNKQYIRFEGVDSAFHLYINECFVGYSQGSRMTSEFDITKHLKAGKNRVVVIVHKFCDGSYLEDQDMWWLSGIFRDVTLINNKADHIYDIRTKAILDENYSKGLLDIDILLKAISNKNDYKLRYILFEDDKVILDKEEQFTLDKSNKQISKHLSINTPHKWTAETPKLYKLIVKFYRNNNLLEVIPIKIGFRTIEIKDGIMYLNGRYIMLKGVNIHDFHPRLGRIVTKEIIRKDLVMIKKNNMNAIRTSHYPHNKYLYHLCDELGLYVIDEADIECNGFEFTGNMNMLADSDDWKKAFLDRMERLVIRDINHPSIIMWSLGNEAGFGENFIDGSGLCRHIDPSRLIHYEEDRNAIASDVYSSMYTKILDLDRIGCLELDKPHIVCEYAHAMGNGPGGLEDYWKKFKKYKRIQGAFIWEWLDQGIEEIDENNNTYYKYGGDYGDHPNNSSFVIDGIVTPNRQETPGLQELKKVLQPVDVQYLGDKKVKLINEYDFINLEGFRLYWVVKTPSNILFTGSYYLNLESKASMILDIPFDLELLPMEDIFLDIDICMDRDLDWCNRGHIVSREQILIKEACRPLRIMDADIRIEEDIRYYSITGLDFSVTFDRVFGRIASYVYRDEKIINEELRLNLWRPPIDNDVHIIKDLENSFLHKLQERIISIDKNVKSNVIKIEVESKIVPPTFVYGYKCSYTYMIYGNGLITVDIKGESFGNVPKILPKIGMTTRIGSRLSNNKWYGKGPHESYIDRDSSCNVDIFTKSTGEMYTDYVYPQESGNRSDVRWFSVTDILGNGLFVTSKQRLNFSALYYSDENIQNAKHQNEVTKEDSITLDIDYKHNGLGSASWGQEQLKQHKLFFTDFQYGFKLIGFNNNDIDESTMYRLLE